MQPQKGNYLIKDVIYEQNQKRQFEFHKKKLKEIISQPLQLDSDQVIQKLNYKHEQMKQTQQFMNQQQLIEKSRIDNNLVQKLMQTNSFKSQLTMSSRSVKRNVKTKMQLNTINDQNRSLATRIFTLPSVINTQQQLNSYKNHISDLRVMQRFHKQKPLKHQDPVATQIINVLGKSFTESKYQSLHFLQQVSKNYKFLFFIPIKLNLYTKFTVSGNNAANFFIQAYCEDTFLGKGHPLEINTFLNSITGFSVPENFFVLKLKLIKIKQNEDVELGTFNFIESFSPISEKQLKDNLVMKISEPIQSNLNKEISDETIQIGSIEYNIVQFCWLQNRQPQIKTSNTQYLIEVQQMSPQKSPRKKSHSQIDELI